MWFANWSDMMMCFFAVALEMDTNGMEDEESDSPNTTQTLPRLVYV